IEDTLADEVDHGVTVGQALHPGARAHGIAFDNRAGVAELFQADLRPAREQDDVVVALTQSFQQPAAPQAGAAHDKDAHDGTPVKPQGAYIRSTVPMPSKCSPS